jgi:hypothetical protein
MLDLRSSLGVNEEKVAAEVIDGETIIIDRVSGVYYSMDKIGSIVWIMIQDKYTLEEIVSTISRRSGVALEQVQADIRALVQELLRENLVVVSDIEAAKQAEQAPQDKERLAYEGPKLNIYRDMEDLLAVDPPNPGFTITPWKEANNGSSTKPKV